MRATVLKQTGRNVAAFRRFYSSIDRAALPAPFPCLYRPFPCSPLLSSPFLPFLPPLSVSSLSLPSLSVARGLVLLLDSTPYFFLYPHFGLRTVGTRLFFSLPFLSRLYLFPSPPPPSPPPPLPPSFARYTIFQRGLSSRQPGKNTRFCQ